MMFTATVAGMSAGGNHILKDVLAENGMSRQHCWLDAEYRGRLVQMDGMRVQIQGQYRRYRNGRDGWTIEKIQSVVVLP